MSRARPTVRRVGVFAGAAPEGSKPDGTASKTLSNLDAVLGVQDEPAEAEAKRVRCSGGSESPTPRVCFLYLLFWPLLQACSLRAPRRMHLLASRLRWLRG